MRQSARWSRKSRPSISRVLRGRPVSIGERSYVPVVRAVAATKRTAHLRAEGVAGRGEAVVRLVPVAVIERRGTHERWLFPAWASLRRLLVPLLAALLLPTALTLLARALAARWVQQRGEDPMEKRRQTP
jgi:hypothetical protein